MKSQTGRFGVCHGLFVIAMLLTTIVATASPGPRRAPRAWALVGATIVTSPGEQIEGGTVLVRDGRIQAVGQDLPIAADVRVIDVSGSWVYPAFLDPAAGDRLLPEGDPSAVTGAVHEVERLHPQNSALDQATPMTDDRADAVRALRRNGFAVATVDPVQGILRGTSAALLLLDQQPVADIALQPKALSHVAFEAAGFGQAYPASLMGSIASIRQALIDADRFQLWTDLWLKNPTSVERPPRLSSTPALSDLLARRRKVLFVLSEAADARPALELTREFGLDAALLGSGFEWEIATELASTRPTVILPLTRPLPPRVESEAEASDLSRQQLRRWLEAPAAARRLTEVGLPVAFTTRSLTDLDEFPQRLQAAVDAGLSDDDALAALTTTPATLLGLEAMVGRIAPGLIANLQITSGPLFQAGTRVESVFVDGEPFEIRHDTPPSSPTPVPEPEKEPPTPRPDVATTETAEPEIAVAERQRLTPAVILVRNATVWTQGPSGTLENSDLLVRAGRIAAVGSGLEAPPEAHVIDASGLHVTPGLIDAHSHVATRGEVNEGSNNITAEVRIADVLTPDDVAIHRIAAGGVTTSHILHGSANSIGGQTAVIKHHWPATVDEIHLQEAPAGIKMALGENPKRSNHPELNGRYPETRMGVIESIRERFVAAREYSAEWDRWQLLSEGERRRRVPPRRDLQLEAIAEILRGERDIHAHSYRGDEILALLRLAEQHGLRVATFQHVLEGYKVAKELAAAGAGASCFSDWWAYKFEVYDAIPHNAALMVERGVLTSLNSDSSELARRLNTEAAKAIRWGGLSPRQALDLVTINPARQIGLDRRLGSLEPGKDADFVIWNGPPLSTSTIVLETWIDGIREFHRPTELAWAEQVEAERQALVAAVRTELAPDDEPEVASPPALPLEAPSSTTSPIPEEPVAATSTEPPKAPWSPPAEPLPRISIVHATVHTDAGTELPDATVSFADGRILEVGPGLPPLDGAEVIDAGGRHLYPGFVALVTALGLSEIDSVHGTVDTTEVGDLNPELRAGLAVNPDSEILPVTLAAGITHAQVVPRGGLVSGSSSVIRLEGWTSEEMVAVDQVALHVHWPSFALVTPQPDSDMPSVEEQTRQRHEKIQAIRRLFADARAWARARDVDPATPRDPALEVLAPVLEKAVPVMIHVDRSDQLASALEWATEEDLRVIVVGGAVLAESAPLLAEKQIPAVLTDVLDNPRRRDDPYDEAFTRARRLHDAGVTFAISTGFGSSPPHLRDLPGHAAMAVAFGLPAEAALAAITSVPAEILGLGDQLGTIEAGKSASFILVDGNPLEIPTRVAAMWIDGRPVDPDDNRHERLARRYRSRP